MPKTEISDEQLREWAAETERTGHGYRERNIARLRNERNALARRVIMLEERVKGQLAELHARWHEIGRLMQRCPDAGRKVLPLNGEEA